MKIFKLRLILHWSLFPMVRLKYSSTVSDYGLVPARQQAFIWTNDGYIIDASLGLNELTHLHVNSPPANTPIKDSVTKAALLIGTIVKTKLPRLLRLPVPGNNGCDPAAVWTIRTSFLKYRRIHTSEIAFSFLTSPSQRFPHCHDDVTKWNHFPRYWPFVRRNHRSPVNSPHKGQWRGALMLSLICVWINGWVNNREAGDLRRYPAHYDVTVMVPFGIWR